LLSHRRWKLTQIADLFEIDRDTVSAWFDCWQSQQPLRDAARKKSVADWVREGLHRSRDVARRVRDNLQKNPLPQQRATLVAGGGLPL
jgi:hypothetical protein